MCQCCTTKPATTNTEPVQRCAVLGVLSWFAGVLRQIWIDVSVRCPHAERYNESSSKTGLAAMTGEREKVARYGLLVTALVFEMGGADFSAREHLAGRGELAALAQPTKLTKRPL